MRNRRKGNSYAAVELDMSKAYDREEWQFLEKMMCKRFLPAMGGHNNEVRYHG